MGRWGCDREVSLGVDPLALSARSSRKPFFLFRDISSSSSSELLSIRTTMSPRAQTLEDLFGSSSESEMWITSSPYSSFFSSRWNWSIFASSDKCEEVVSSLGIAASRGERQEGNSSCTMSSWAKNPGTEMSIRASWGHLLWSRGPCPRTCQTRA